MADRAEYQPITGADADIFLSWCKGAGFTIDPEIDVQAVLAAFSGFTKSDLRWLCAAMRQANNAPDLGRMAKAIKARDVAPLRDRNP